MTKRVRVKPLPAAWRKIPPDWRPTHPPIFPGDGEPTEIDLRMAVELWAALDPESRAWYGDLPARLGVPVPESDDEPLNPAGVEP